VLLRSFVRAKDGATDLEGLGAFRFLWQTVSDKYTNRERIGFDEFEVFQVHWHLLLKDQRAHLPKMVQGSAPSRNTSGARSSVDVKKGVFASMKT
jgi:hypothetical protein